ncbi:MAG TPA: prepilin-type N-terminal cleavage/methylation domain-containing protein [Gemmatimonadales bacterium]|nr:prepilin-type N-terminal cleavage/methylation domain-containing protein [Gemmatimonadales bacterium]
MRDRRGMTLIEMMIAITVFSVIMAGALGFLSQQSKGLDQNSSDMDMLQNLSFSGALMSEDIRMAGANVPYAQPSLVYAGVNSFIFNADYSSNTDSLYAIYYNPGLPAGQVNALTASQKFNLPGTSPVFAYPDSNYYASGSSGVNSPAETISWFFAADTLAGYYLLERQVNNAAPEVVVRNVQKTAGTNFFRYYWTHIPSAGTSKATLDTVPTAWVPMKHSVAIHGSVGDTGSVAHIDSLAAVEVAFTVTNGLTGSALRTRAIDFMVPMPNVGTAAVTSCGDIPILGSAVSANWNVDSTVSPWDTTMILTWNQAVDEVGGEKDVKSYVIWRRNVGDTTWPDPIATVPAGFATPSYNDQTAVVGAPGYQYGLAAQDCTPSLSAMATVTAPLHP